jgi:hypothetical protein
VLLSSSLRLGIAVTPNRHGRLLIAPELLFTQQSYSVPDPQAPGVIDTGMTQLFMVSIPIGFQYDFPIRKVPGLSLYPQFLFGYTLRATVLTGQLSLQGGDTSGYAQNGMASVAFGIRYVWRRKLDFSLEPFGMAVYGPNPSTILIYRTMASIGATF